MNSTTDAAKEIRTTLKAKGWNSRKVSVRADLYSMGSTLRVTIKDASVPIDEVREIAEAKERVHRCEITGDILSGGNRFVDVNYSRAAIAELAKPYTDKVRAAFESIATDDITTCATVTDGIYVCRVHKGVDSFHLRMPNRSIWLYGAHESGFADAAAVVAIATAGK